MLCVALSIAVLLAVTDAAPQDCTVEQQELARMLQLLEGSVTATGSPNPSVLLALNLAGASGSDAGQQLLKQLEEDAVQRAEKGLSSGQVALYTLALLSSCRDPRLVKANGLSVDLVSVLQKKTDEEVAHLELWDVPVSTLFSVGLDALALCLVDAGGYEEAAVLLAKQVLRAQSQLSVDTQATMALALVCAYERTELLEMQALLRDAVTVVADGFLLQQAEGNGVIGNIYSTGLAMQVLLAAGEFYTPSQWDCAQALAAIVSHNLQLPMAIAQALPAMVGRSYLDAGSLKCSNEVVTATILQLDMSPSQDTMAQEASSSIEVHYTIANDLRGQPFRATITVSVPDGSVLLAVLQAAEAAKPDVFSFKTKETSWGPMVVSIHGLEGSEEDRTYWQFFSGADSLQEGVGTYKPWDGEHIQAVFSLY